MIRQSDMMRWAATMACGLALAGPAAAQIAGNNSNAPVDITADQLTVVNAECLATYTGSAEALQDTARLRSDVLKIYYKPLAPAPAGAAAPAAGRSGGSSKCASQLDHMEAIGSVYYVTPNQRVHGDNAYYDADADTITITGDVVAAQGDNVARGTKMVIKVSTGDAQMQTSVSGRNKPNRVRTVIYPKQQQQPAGQTAAPR